MLSNLRDNFWYKLTEGFIETEHWGNYSLYDSFDYGGGLLIYNNIMYLGTFDN